jgi:hypothetical protein
MSFYGTIEKANAFFALRLHTAAWDDVDTATRTKALHEATHLIEKLNFKGDKHSVYALADGASDEAIHAANVAQPREFPRDSDTIVPDTIEHATYFVAYALLDGRDPELELENLAITSHRYSSVGTAYNRDIAPLEHIVNSIPSVSAWNLLKPFLRPNTELQITRTS